MSTEPNKVIYSMVGVSKYYDKKAVLKDIYLSYFYGAKIGVIGLNARANHRSCAYWRAWTRSLTARPLSRRAIRSAFWNRSR